MLKWSKPYKAERVYQDHEVKITQTFGACKHINYHRNSGPRTSGLIGLTDNRNTTIRHH